MIHNKNMFNNKVVLVTGGAGFIGSHIVDRCLDLGAEKVISFDNKIGTILNNHAHLDMNDKFKFVKGDITKAEEIKPSVEEADFIFSEATSKQVMSLKNPLLDVEINAFGNLQLLELIRNSSNNPRIVHASTGSVFGDSTIPYNDFTSMKKPATVYGINKLAAEHYHLLYTKEHGIRSSIVRYYHVFGPRQVGKAGVINIFLSRVLNGLAPKICGTGEALRCFTYVRDSADANFLIAQSNNTIGKRYNAASKTRMTVLELANKIISKYGPPEMKPEFIESRRGEVLKPVPDTKPIEELGFKETLTFDEGLDLSKKWISEDMENRSWY